jgi:hypothetical protein
VIEALRAQSEEPHDHLHIKRSGHLIMGETLLDTTGAGGSLIAGSTQPKCSVQLGSMRQGRRRFDHLLAAATRPDPDTLPTAAVLALGRAQTMRRRTAETVTTRP